MNLELGAVRSFKICEEANLRTEISREQLARLLGSNYLNPRLYISQYVYVLWPNNKLAEVANRPSAKSLNSAQTDEWVSQHTLSTGYTKMYVYGPPTKENYDWIAVLYIEKWELPSSRYLGMKITEVGCLRWTDANNEPKWFKPTKQKIVTAPPAPDTKYTIMSINEILKLRLPDFPEYVEKPLPPPPTPVSEPSPPESQSSSPAIELWSPPELENEPMVLSPVQTLQKPLEPVLQTTTTTTSTSSSSAPKIITPPEPILPVLDRNEPLKWIYIYHPMTSEELFMWPQLMAEEGFFEATKKYMDDGAEAAAEDKDREGLMVHLWTLFLARLNKPEMLQKFVAFQRARLSKQIKELTDLQDLLANVQANHVQLTNDPGAAPNVVEQILGAHCQGIEELYAKTVKQTYTDAPTTSNSALTETPLFTFLNK